MCALEGRDGPARGVQGLPGPADRSDGAGGASRASLARRVGIDRSTLTQLLSAEVDRLPRADTVAAVAAELKVSLDWLLGLSQVEKLGADILHESLQVAQSAQHPVDEQLIAWFEEAAGDQGAQRPGDTAGLREDPGKC